MLRAHRQTPKAQACQLFANSSLMHGDAEALFDLAFQINAPPAHNPIGFGVGTRPNHFRQLLLLCRAQQTGWIRRATVEQARHALRIVTVGPIPQRLPIHAAVFCRRLAVNPIQNQGNRQHPSRRFPIPAPRRFLAKLACGLVFARNPYCHQSLPCLDATESDHAARGNPLESNLGAVGIRQYLEPLVEPVFHRDSYGYRPERSAIDAIRTARRRCWRFDWVLDMDIKGFFDTIDHELLLKAVRHHTDCRWVLLYIERWLKAPVMMEGGSLVSQERGTPQGGVISPLLANLFLHYAFDKWMDRENPQVPFERYADDIICHCRTEGEARRLWRQVEDRLAECGLSLHPQKTKIVYCKDTNRKGSFPTVAFDFLGYRFQPRLAIWRGGLFGVSYLPAAAPKALKAFRRRVRNWGLQRRSDKGLTDLARMFNRQIEGWIGYFRCFYKSALYPTLRLIDAHLVRWVMRKYKRFKQRPRQARLWLARIVKSTPGLFAHWSLLYANG